jgi:hypothetical protein
MPELTITSPYICPLQSRPNTFTMGLGNPMPESTLTLCQSRLYPPVRDLGFGLWGFHEDVVNNFNLQQSDCTVCNSLQYTACTFSSANYIIKQFIEKNALHNFLVQREETDYLYEILQSPGLGLSRVHAVLNRAGIFKESMGARNRGGIGLSYRPAGLHRLAEFIPWNRFLGSINV